MMYLSGVKRAGRPLLQTPGSSYALHDVPVWALDNGCFTDSYPGDEQYLAHLSRWLPHLEKCLWVAVPDVVGDAAGTLDAWPRMADRIRALGYKACLVLQDGMTAADVAAAAPDAVFIGGTDDFKLGREARNILASFSGPKHMGRVNSLKRLRYAWNIGCDTADGTVLAFDPQRSIWDWADQLRDQGVLDVGA